jgi:hypothetical protein
MADTDDNGSRASTAPYAAFPSIKTALRSMKEHGVPTRIDRSALNNLSGSTAGQVLTAFRFLGLMDAENRPKGRMQTLVDAIDDDQKWPEALAETVKTAYAPMFQHNIGSLTASHFRQLFKENYQGADDVQRKSMATFIVAMQEAKLPVSNYLTKQVRPRAGGATGRKKTKTARKTATAAFAALNQKNPQHENPPPPPPPPAVEKPLEYQLLDLIGPDLDDPERQAVFTLLTYLKQRKGAA